MDYTWRLRAICKKKTWKIEITKYNGPHSYVYGKIEPKS